ncbi:protein kinase, putative [Plasmodium ovale wallikeri]|uniref:Protein kinase, putative n=1 Tax=Plasmodium ovale wallikeri TaxID=864142 RepID=A0A1A8Z842_PLAOA|nr:protein kinase, putative [Plasmodium ovale wallikeri]SBT40115.1 protein kinase, putative [Plasmodium ovale wallikeri]
MKFRNLLYNNNNNLLNSFCLESETNVLKDHIPINILKENNKKKIFYSYNIIDGYKYKIIVKRRKDNLNNTRLLVSSLDHPYILKLIHCCEYASSLISVLEFFSETSLYSVIFSTKYDERKIKHILYQIILTVNYLHSRNLVHKNLSPHSFLIKSVNNEVMIKLEDVYKIRAPSTKSNLKMKSQNVYNIGLIMYFLVCGRYPFFYSEKTEENFFFQNELWKKISPRGRTFIKRILLSDLSSMMTIREVLDHEWFKENVKQNIYINVDVLRNIYDFWRKNVFKRYILNNISKFIVKEDIYKYNSLFFYFDIMEEGSIKYEQYFAIMKKLDVIACLLNSFIKIDKKTALRFFKKVDYDSEGIITKKKLYKFYNMKTKNEISTNDKRKFTFEEFYSYISKV